MVQVGGWVAGYDEAGAPVAVGAVGGVLVEVVEDEDVVRVQGFVAGDLAGRVGDVVEDFAGH